MALIFPPSFFLKYPLCTEDIALGYTVLRNGVKFLEKFAYVLVLYSHILFFFRSP